MPRRERPLAPGDGALLRFAADLRRLRQEAGNPPYRTLSNRAHFSIAALSGAAAGKRLPSLEVTLAYVKGCGGDTGEWERRWHDVAAELAAEAAAEAAANAESEGGDATGGASAGEGDSGCEGAAGGQRAPYAGLSAFQPDDAEWFFGREELVEDLVRRVDKQRIVAVFGASGAGKSSLLRAGLLPRLRSQSRTVLLFTPGPHPLEELAILLAGPSRYTPGTLCAEFGAEPRNVHRTVRRITAEGPPDAEVVLVVDQFEEIFTVCRTAEERRRFVSALVFAASTAKSRCRVVLGVRADFYAHCAEEPELVEALRDAQLTVGPMNADELHRAIVRPAARVGCRVEGRLLSHLVAHAQGQAAVLPLLSHVLLETWRRRRGNQLTLAGFRAAGGVEGSLTQTAEAFHASLDPRQQAVARQLFLRLTALGDGTEDTGRRISRGELDADEDTATVLERAAEARLITLDGDRVELAHEALIRVWPRLRGWLTGSRRSLRIHRQLTEAAEEWESLGRDPDLLYRGSRLALGRDATGSGLGLTAREREFLDAASAAEAAEAAAAQRRSRRLRLLVATLAVLLALTTAMTVYAMRVGDEAARQRNSAVALSAAGEAAGLVGEKPGLAVQVALAAYRLEPGRATRDTLLSTLMPSWDGHRGAVLAVAAGPGRGTAVTAGADHAVRLWDVHRPRDPELLSTVGEHDGGVYAVAMRPGGDVLATADRTVRMWDVTDPRHPRLLSESGGHTGAVRSLAFSPDGRTLVSASNDGTARLWDTRDPRRPGREAVLRGHEGAVRSAAFGGGGRLLATGGDDGDLRLWDTRDPDKPKRVARLRAHRLGVFSAAFSPRDDVLATGGGGGSPLRLWDVGDPRKPRLLASPAGHSDVVGAVAFSPDGRRLASGSDDRTVRTWDVRDAHRPRGTATLSGYTTAVAALRYSADGRALVTGVFDGKVRLLPSDRRRVIAEACGVRRKAISRSAWQQRLSGVPYDPPCR
ncbi:nSTAND1 domain-containing NTPase [Streptomyces marispadix]|uniref:XRE family transcriptional regulator n=1 Tax=Streptomyces marispadix TaxID=2922868 RepID=A0ABS9T3J6_9ACTN|nr:XRE family transcriptional regulator [Streptomyces marispadix]MCH6163096.1 XRE family transcriptional regulator [Streptomyces marispadix]